MRIGDVRLGMELEFTHAVSYAPYAKFLKGDIGTVTYIAPSFAFVELTLDKLHPALPAEWQNSCALIQGQTEDLLSALERKGAKCFSTLPLASSA